MRIRGATYQDDGTKATGWQHLVVVVEKISGTQSTVILYRNGAVLWSQTLSAVLGNPSGKAWTIGQDWDGDTRTDFYNGLMDDVVVYNKALTEAEVQARYNDGAGVP